MKFVKLLCVLFFAVLLHSCQKEYSNEKLMAPIGSWQFVNAGSTYSGYLDDYHSTTGNVGSNAKTFSGKTFDNSQSFELKIYTDSLKIGTYRDSQFQCSFLYSSNNKTIFEANGLIGEFIVNISSADSTQIVGTFSGTVADQASNDVQITEGQFSIKSF